MRRFAIAGLVVLFALVGGAAMGLSAITTEDRPANATVAALDPEVAVGNESGGDSTDGVVSCVDRGPLPGNAGLAGSLVLERPVGDDGPREATVGVNVTVADGAVTDTHTVALATGERERLSLLAVAERTGALTAGESATVGVRVRTDNRTVATAERSVTVVERDAPCADERERVAPP